MKKLFVILGAAILIFGFAGNTSKFFAQETNQPERYGVAFASHPGDPATFDVVVYDRSQSTTVFTKTIDNFNTNHYHNFEVHNGNLYALKEVGDTSTDNWAHELWLYTADGERLLFSSKGLDFRVAPNESWVALVYPLPPDYFYGGLGFLDLAGGQVLHEFAFEYVDEMLSIAIEKWSHDSSNLWVKFAAGPTPAMFSKVNTQDWSVVDYELGEINIGADGSLNPNSGYLVYSDHPTFFDVMSANDFAQSGQPVSLYVFNFDQGVESKIAESVARQFNPFWADDMVAGYHDPASDTGAMTYYDLATGSIVDGAAFALSNVSPGVIPAGFEPFVQELQSAQFAPMLPAEFPIDAGQPDIFPYVYFAEGGRYELSLDFGEDCMGTGACHYGSMMIQKTASEVPIGSEYNLLNIWTAQKVILEKGIQGYFVESVCGANCSDAQVFWVYAGHEYMVGLKGAPLEPVAALANGMIGNSIP